MKNKKALIKKYARIINNKLSPRLVSRNIGDVIPVNIQSMIFFYQWKELENNLYKLFWELDARNHSFPLQKGSANKKRLTNETSY